MGQFSFKKGLLSKKRNEIMDDKIYFTEGFSNTSIDRLNIDTFIDNLEKNDHLSHTESIFDDLFEEQVFDFDFDDNDMSEWYDE